MAPRTMSQQQPEEYHSVVVVGAGVAGLQAARQLLPSFPDLLVLEASHRIGGRVKQVSGRRVCYAAPACSWIELVFGSCLCLAHPRDKACGVAPGGGIDGLAGGGGSRVRSRRHVDAQGANALPIGPEHLQVQLLCHATTHMLS